MLSIEEVRSIDSRRQAVKDEIYHDINSVRYIGMADGRLRRISITDHVDLSSVGKKSHPQIDTHIADNDVHFIEDSINHDALANFVANKHIDWTELNAGTIDPSNYVDEDTTDHAALSNIGTKTHAEIDTHLALTNEHIDWTNASQNLKTTGNIFIYKASNPKIQIAEGGSSTSFFRIEDSSAEQVKIEKTANTGNVFMDFNVMPSDGSSGSNFRFFRDVNTSGSRLLTLYKGDGTSAFNIRFNAATGDALFRGDVTMQKDLLFTGNGSGLIIGEISVVSNVSEVAIVSQNVYVQITDFDTNGNSNNTTPDHTSDHILIDIAGVYFITCSITLESIGGAGSTAEMEVQKNNGNSRVGALHVDRTLSGGGTEAGAISMSGFAILAVNDTVEVWIRNESNQQNYIVEDITLSLTLVGGV